MLRVIEGGAEGVTPLREEDLPLGPWAGAQVRVWATKTGTRWHADADCSSLRSQARTEVFDQPMGGALGQRRLPAELHCPPPGRLGEYLRAARTLVRFAADTDEAERQWGNGDITLDALPGRHGYLIEPAEHAALDEGALAPVWAREQERRRHWMHSVDQELAPAEQRLPIMVMADWIRRGRTPREHQPRYDRFVRLATRELKAAELTINIGNKRYINGECLPDWLDDVVRGRTCENATTSMVEREYNDVREPSGPDGGELPERVRDAWRRIGERWQQALEAMAWAHPGVVLALFGLYATDIDHDLLDVCVRRGPAAQVDAGHLDWTVAVVPAACRVGLAERDQGLGGLVLLEGPLHGVDQACCERFLRNLVVSLEHPALADRVTAPGAGSGHGATAELSEEELEAGLALHQLGFGAEGWGSRVTVGRCAAALRAAVRGVDLRQSSMSRSQRGRKPRQGSA